MLLFGFSLNSGSRSKSQALSTATKKIGCFFLCHNLSAAGESCAKKWCHRYWQNLPTTFGSECRSADPIEYYRGDIVFYHIRAVTVHLSQGGSSRVCTGWSAARPVSRQRQNDETLWFLQQFIYTPLSTTPNLLTLNMVAACLGCWRVLLFRSIYLIFTDVSWKGLCQNAEYAMLLVNVPMIKMDF